MKFEGAGGGKSKVLRNSVGVFFGSIVKKTAVLMQVLYSCTARQMMIILKSGYREVLGVFFCKAKRLFFAANLTKNWYFDFLGIPIM